MKSAVAGALLLAVIAVPARAGEIPLYQPVPGWAAPAPRLDAAAIKAGPAIVVLDQQVRIEKDTVSTYSDVVIRIDTPEMLTQFALLNGAWMPDKGDFIIHRAQILREGEAIDLLADDRFEVLRREVQLEQRVLNGMLTANLPVKGLRVGDAVRLSATTTERDGALGGKVQKAMAIIRDEAAIGFGRILLSWPEGMAIKWRAGPRVAMPAGAERTSDGWHVLTVPVGQADQAMPADAPLRYRRPSLVQASSFADWPDVSRTMAGLFATDGLIAPGSPLAAEVAAIEASRPDALGRTAAALQLVQGKVSYLLMGMNGGNYVPQPPARTWELRYGDCKAKSLLLLAMLREMGIEAEAVLVNTAMGDALPELLPQPGDFDHVIVRAVIDGRELWLDGTRSGTRVDDIGDLPPFAHALPLRSGGADLLALPRRAPMRPTISATLSFDASAGVDLPMPFEASIVMRGDYGAMIHLAEGQAGEQKRDELIRGMVLAYLPDAQMAKKTLRWDEAAGTATVEAKGVTWRDWTFDHGGIHLPLNFGDEDFGFSPDRARPAWKSIPVATAAPSAAVLRVTMRLPENGKGFVVEGDGTFEGSVAGAAISRQAALAGPVLTIDERVDRTGAEIAPEAVAAEKARAAQVVARLPRLGAPADIQRYWQFPAKGDRSRFAALEAAYEQVVASDPKNADAYANRGRFRELSGDTRGALADYDRAIGLEPTVWLYRTRAGLREGMTQFDGALADIIAAEEIDPADDGIAGAHATLLSRTGKTEEGIALLEERIANGGRDNANLFVVLADLLTRTGRTEEALARLDGELAGRPGNPDLLNGKCWTRGTMDVLADDALRECTKAIELSENPAQALDSRALIYFRMGRLDDAVADLDAALSAMPDQAGSLFLRAVIGQRRGAAGWTSDLAAARRIDPGIDAAYLRYGIAAPH